MMEENSRITGLFLDIGGVLLSSGWDHSSRKQAAEYFDLDPTEFEERHHIAFETYEKGKLTQSEYLALVIFHKNRSFTQAQFERFMFAQSKPDFDMLELIKQLKKQYNLKIIVVSNEGRALNFYRIQNFGLRQFVDSFISSCYVGIRKPNADIFRLALDISQVPKEEIIYIENTGMFVEIAQNLGIKSLLHTDYKSTYEKLLLFGLKIDAGMTHGIC